MATIARTPMVDDDGSGTTGTVINAAWKTELYDQIDAALAATAGGGVTGIVTTNAAQSIPTAAWTPLVFQVEEIDTANVFTIAQPTRLTAPAAGVYLMTGLVSLTAYAPGGISILLAIRKTGADVHYLSQVPSTNSTGGVSFALELSLTANDYLELAIYQTTGAPYNVSGGGAAGSRFTLTKIG